MLALVLSAVFLMMRELEIALVALALWPLIRAAISVLDVFVLFFTQRPLVREPADRANARDARVCRAEK